LTVAFKIRSQGTGAIFFLLDVSIKEKLLSESIYTWKMEKKNQLFHKNTGELKMAKDSKRKLTFITLLLMLLLISSAHAVLVPTVNAAEPNLQEKTLSVLNDVVGLNAEQYATSQSTQRDSQFLSHPQTETDIHLTAEEGSLRVTCSYVKDTLKLVYLSDVEGDLALKQPAANTVEMAKGLLERYQTYSGESFYGEFASMLADVDANVDVTKFARDVKLEVSGSDQNEVTYVWTYIDENGVVAERKNVILIYERGVFKGFFNNWPLYTIVDTTPKISSEEATAIAIEASKNYTYKVTTENGKEITVSGFTIAPESLGYAKLVYVNSKEQDYARGGDPFKLYLAWHVPLGFDRFYPADVSGLTVILWADTGEVCGMNRVITSSGLPTSEDAEADAEKKEVAPQPVSQQSNMLPMMVVVAAVVVMVSLVTCKRSKLVGMKLSSKRVVMLLCATIMFSVMLAIPIASAAYVTGRSRIYACIDGNGYGNEADVYEGVAAAEVCNFIGNASLDAGYVTSNLYGSWGTTATNVVNQAGSDEQNYLNTMVFHVGHQAGFGVAYQDNNGNPITDTNIYAQTGLGRHFFTFIWVCAQADVPIDQWCRVVEYNATRKGMPIAWTHRDNSPGHPYMNAYGFGNPDGSGQCYISFYGFSPMLSTHYKDEGGNYSVFYEYNIWGNDIGPCKWFIMKFYYYALYEGYSVHDSLNIASNEYFGCNYGSSVLNLGYSCWWPGGGDEPFDKTGFYPIDFYPERPKNSMRVFGDSSIKLCQPQITLSARDNYNNPLYPAFTIDGQTEYTGSCRLVAKSYNVSVNDLPNYDFSRFSYKGANYYSRPSSILLDADGTLTAHYTWNPTNYTLSISSSGGGSTNPSGTHEYLSYTNVNIQAVPDNASRIFDHWILDSEDAGMQNPIKVTMNSNHTLQAFFTYAPSHYWVSSIYDYGDPVNNPNNLVGSQPYGQFAGIASLGPYEIYGWIIGTMNSQATGHIYVYGSGCGYLSVYVSSNGYDWNFVSSPYVSSGSPYWINCGTYQSSFNYILLTAEDPSTIYSVDVDSVRVEP